MKCFAGIDIGTTNIKLLVLNQDGLVCHSASALTPYLMESGRKYFDLSKLDSIIDSMVEQAKSCGKLVSVGFSSVGETVVPVKDGKALGNPVFWGELSVTSTAEEREIADKLSGYLRTGVVPNGIMSLDKILWHKRNDVLKPDYFLPFTTYEIYRCTGCVTWCYSQASRSNAYLVEKKAWNQELLDAYGIQAPGELGPYGMYCGEKDGVVYGLGGHDHITGLYGLYCATGDSAFIFDSMGTSCTINLLSDKPLTPQQIYNPLVGGLVNGFEDGQFVILRGLCAYGSLTAFWMKHFGYEPTAENYEAVNRMILENRDKPLNFTAKIGVNYYKRKDLPRGRIDYSCMDMNASVDRFVESSYAYNLQKTLQIVKDLKKHCSFDDIPYYVGGGAASNGLFMSMKATALKHSVVRPDISEICVLGAACTGITASGNTQVYEVMRQRMKESKVVEPSAEFQDFVDKGSKAYKGRKF